MDQLRPTSPNQISSQIITTPPGDRWQVYSRLQELDIACACQEDGSFRAEINSPAAAAQLWSVIYQLTASRHQLIRWLERCW